MLLGAHTRTGLQMYIKTHHKDSEDRCCGNKKKLCPSFYFVLEQNKTPCVLPVALPGQVVNNSGRSDSLPSTRRTLDQTERPLQHRLHSVHLDK